MEKEFVPYELALKLKELGFNEDCLGWYHKWIYDNKPEINFRISKYDSNDENLTPAPLWQQAFDWFRNEYKIHCIIYQIELEDKNIVWDWDIVDNNSGEEIYDIPYHNSYEEARLESLKKLIEITNEKKSPKKN